MAEETTVQFPLTEELQQLIEAAEATGVIEHADLMEAIETIEYEPTDLEILLRELEDRGIELGIQKIRVPRRVVRRDDRRQVRRRRLLLRLLYGLRVRARTRRCDLTGACIGAGIGAGRGGCGSLRAGARVRLRDGEEGDDR